MPVHGITQRQIEGWHFRSDDNTEDRKPGDSLTGGIGVPRPFDFVTSSADQAKSCDDLDRVVHIYDEENPEHKKAMDHWRELVGGKGSLSITDFKLCNLKPGAQAWIEVMKFDVSITFRRRQNIKKADPGK